MDADAGDLKDIRVLSRMYSAGETRERPPRATRWGAESKTSEPPSLQEYEAEETDELPGPLDSKGYRRIATVVNYLAWDRPDVQFAAGLPRRIVAGPTSRSWNN